MPRPLLRHNPLFLLLGLLPACLTWHEQQLPVQQVLAEEHPEVVRVTRQDQSHVVLAHPQLAADTLVGQLHGTPTAIPLSDVTSIALHKDSLPRTLGLFALFLSAGIVGIAAAACCGN